MSEQAIPVLLHVAANVEAGLDGRHGSGFQTVQASEALLGTEDLQLLETVAPYYEVTPQRRAAGEFPIKESFFALPSGRFAVGRTVDWGTSASGRAGNFLARHLVVDRDTFRGCGMDPFRLLDAAWPEMAPELVPEALPLVRINFAAVPVNQELGSFPQFSEASLTTLLLHATGEARITLLLPGEEGESRRLLRALFAALPTDQRERCTFSTHFYRACVALSGHFRLATVRDGSEAPTASRELISMILEGSNASVLSGYEGWLACRLRAGDWPAIHVLNRTVEAVQAGSASPEALPENRALHRVLWQRVGSSLAPLLLGRPDVCTQLLQQLSVAESRQLAEALLRLGSPGVVCGEETDPAKECLVALKRAAGGAAWKAWNLRWKEDPLLQDRTGSASGPRWAWWRR